ncbi:MAG TPA: crossover junction endodeoxyribonuclease RuvC [Terriglobales bacterium]|nr:crossover junction endodeoxyribonuclease RuvC [Terriglobales bacterium]
MRSRVIAEMDANPVTQAGWLRESYPVLNQFSGRLHPMRVLGIDCGGEYTGYGVVEQGSDTKLRIVCCGTIRLSTREPLPVRLNRVFERLREVIAEVRPEMVAIEDVFYAVNAKSALKLGQVRGVAMLAASSCGLQVAEYSPLSIKSSVVGYGRAEKSQVQHMVTQLLDLPQAPESPDAADALAIAICHLHTWSTLQKQQPAKAVSCRV